jgi:hypothetical protein
VSLGKGIQVSQHAVMIGNATWVAMGNAQPRRKRSRDAFEFEDQCASSRGFWDALPFDAAPGVHGVVETRGGIAVEHFDLVNVLDAVKPFIDDLPPDVTVERASIWRSKHDDVVVGLDIALHASSPDTCHDMLDLDLTETAPSECTMTIALTLSQFDDPKLAVRPGRGSSGHLTGT